MLELQCYDHGEVNSGDSLYLIQRGYSPQNYLDEVHQLNRFMFILGINGSPNEPHNNMFGIGEGSLHDAAAALLHNGDLVAAIEEERLNRIKHTNKWPKLSINRCLKICGISPNQIDRFAFCASEETLTRTFSRYYKSRGEQFPGLYKFLQNLLERQFQLPISTDRIELYEHHFVHAVSAYYPSRFDASLVLTIDGSGGEYSGTVYNGMDDSLSLLQTFSKDQSIGHFYRYVTHILGFHEFDEFKVMGLAPYGDVRRYEQWFKDCYSLLPDGGYKLHQENWPRLKRLCFKTNQPERSRAHVDIAAGVQSAIEEIVFHLLKHFKRATNSTRLCMSGGVALNCSLNGKILRSGLFDDVFVFPAANDSGLPIGSALASYFKSSKKPLRKPLNNIYLGPGIGKAAEIIKTIKQWKAFISCRKENDISKASATLLAQGNVIGWVQGRSEFAARALGNRSILADPRPESNKERINSLIKRRESFRPFAPSILEECATEYFEVSENGDYRHMMFTVPVKREYREKLGAITHVDGTARIQTVSRSENFRYWEVIASFKRLTGLPILLNTSFNNNAEPIVDSIDDAVVTFLTTNLDYLVVDNLVITKKTFPIDLIVILFIFVPNHIRLCHTRLYGWNSGVELSEHFEILNTYNEKRVTVSRCTFDVLLAADGSRSIDGILNGCRMQSATSRREIVSELHGLWVRRVIVLAPARRKPAE